MQIVGDKGIYSREAAFSGVNMVLKAYYNRGGDDEQRMQTRPTHEFSKTDPTFIPPFMV